MRCLVILLMLCVCSFGQVDYSFGTSHATYNNIPDATNSGLSVVFWMKWSGAVANTTFISDRSTTVGWSVDAGPSPYDKVRFIVDNGPSAVNTTTTNTIDDGSWHHIACVWNDDGTIHTYIDGIDQSGTVASNSGSLVNTSDLYVSLNSVTSTEHYDGILDDVRVCNRELSALDVNELYLLHWVLSDDNCLVARLDVIYTNETGSTLSGVAQNLSGANGAWVGSPKVAYGYIQHDRPFAAMHDNIE